MRDYVKDMKDRDGKSRHAWMATIHYNPLGFPNDPSQSWGDWILPHFRDSNKRDGTKVKQGAVLALNEP